LIELHGDEKLGKIGEGNPDRHQNLTDWFLDHAVPLQQFYQNPFVNFEIFLRTDRQTHGALRKHSLFGGGNKTAKGKRKRIRM